MNTKVALKIVTMQDLLVPSTGQCTDVVIEHIDSHCLFQLVATCIALSF